MNDNERQKLEAALQEQLGDGSGQNQSSGCHFFAVVAPFVGGIVVMMALLAFVLQQMSVPSRLSSSSVLGTASALTVDCEAYPGPTSWELTGDGFRDVQRELKYINSVSSEVSRWSRELNQRGIYRPYAVMSREIVRQMSECGIEAPP